MSYEKSDTHPHNHFTDVIIIFIEWVVHKNKKNPRNKKKNGLLGWRELVRGSENLGVGVI